jgi:hypothetical protein
MPLFETFKYLDINIWAAELEQYFYFNFGRGLHYGEMFIFLLRRLHVKQSI